jgi:hypothetical protein
MAVIETKYSIGDVVYFATTVVENKRHPCPDCLGTQKWSARSPAGTEYTFACPRCSTAYMANRELSLSYPAHVAHATRLTIGSIEATSGRTPYGDDSPVRYMCVETGIGSGSVYNEHRLFATEEEARAAAENLAEDANANTKEIVECYNAALQVSDYQLSDAAERVSERKLLALQSDMRDLVDDLRACDTIEQMKERIDGYDNGAA